MNHADKLSEGLALLRRSFDESFAAPLYQEKPATIDILSVSVEGISFGLRCDEIAAVHARKIVTRVPSSAASLLGVANFRGLIVAVFDLAVMLKQRPSVTSNSAQSDHWLALSQNKPVALAFDTLERHLRIPKDAITGYEGRAGTLAPNATATAWGNLPLLSLPRLLATLEEKSLFTQQAFPQVRKETGP
jgi:chemotaxis signal transduction protein